MVLSFRIDSSSAARFAADSISAFGDHDDVLRLEVSLSAVASTRDGWPAREGRCALATNPPCAAPPAGITQPLTDYPHGTGNYVTGGAFVPNGAWGKAYDGGTSVALSKAPLPRSVMRRMPLIDSGPPIEKTL